MTRSSYPGGPLRDIKRYTTIPEMLEDSAAKWGDRIFMRETLPNGSVREVSFRSLNRMADNFARGIRELGEKPVTAIAGRSGIDWATAFLGTIKAGGVVVPIDKDLPPPDISGIIHYSGAECFFFDPGFKDTVTEHLARGKSVCRHYFVMNRAEDDGFPEIADLIGRGAGLPGKPRPETDPAEPAVISYTSGTMGAAKGVVLSHGNILSDVQMMLSSVFIAEDEVFLSVLPMHHMYECVCGFLCPLQHGCTVVVSRGLRYVAEDLVENGITLVLGVPLLWEGMYSRIMKQIHGMKGGSFKFALGKAVSRVGEFLGGREVRRTVFRQVHRKLGGRLRTIISGGAALDAQVMKGFSELGITILQGYGLTECSPIVAVCRYGTCEPGTVGPPLPDVQVRIENPDSEGAGEILVRGPNVMIGYHNDPAATAEVLSPDGWFRTGDYGVLRKGLLKVTGRKKNVIVSKNGKNVYPEELERIINRSPFISESLVFGRESGAKGEEIWAIVFPDYDALIQLAEGRGVRLSEEFGTSVIREELARVNAKTASFKRVGNFIIRDSEFPKTTTRKIRRQQVLREAGFTREKSYKVTGTGA